MCVMTTFTNWSARKEEGKTSGLISEEQKKLIRLAKKTHSSLKAQILLLQTPV